MKKMIAALCLCACAHISSAGETLKILIPGTEPLSVLGLTSYFCKKEGIDVQITQQANYNHATVVPLLARGEYDLSIVSLPSLLISSSNGIEITAASAVLSGGDGVVARTGINSIKELKGKKVAADKGSGAESFFLEELTKAGLTYTGDNPDITLVNMPPKSMRVAFEAGVVDAFVGIFPDTTDIEDAKKGKVLLDFTEYQRFLGAMRSFYEKPAAQKFYKCWNETAKVVNAKPSKQRDAELSEAIAYANSKGLKVILPPNRNHVYKITPRALPHVIENVNAALIKIGKIRPDYSVPAWFDQSYRILTK